ncbi:MAG: hypothetical protein ACFB00_11255 [Parvularculaceae bacterium]
MADDTRAPSTVGDDLAFLRAVAEQGRRAAKLYGGHLILWGAVIAAAYVNQYAVEATPGASYWRVGVGYLAMSIGGWLGTGALVVREKAKAAAQPASARIFAMIFFSAGLSLTAFALGAGFTDAIPDDVIVLVAAQAMGLCFLALGFLAETRWLVGVGVAWLAASLALPALIERPVFYLASAFVWLALMVGPGVVLSRKAAQTAGETRP